ncbi:LLM class flavin-dependent oxidoreductase [Kribbella italica]|uniref:Alkanesulfonate monooxygenase SsuD/methylene tetrahydromethanopterin reductase-like flavin-dependent oxidoreductase (Luciferase family) n=1 Tax=Kribbella italica TaxID=1540520 RepID=A0A7W9MWH5_9ACTN|nr:LLM class flavin-dependent oxidoreductase [Kribbella italica]MBB5838275.1 alkanesulfonate monooxygenase SsuD/methylene tetrahydromethanopterin reductase-like flavin-dependent oxidoreductase (luciferase family) [Kribbella italica]
MTVRFGIGAPSALPALLRTAEQADRDGLDHLSIADHPYGARALDAYAAIGWVLARTERISGLVNVTNLPLRPAPILARTASTLAALSGDRLVLGLGAGGAPDLITAMGGRQQTPREAVDAFEEAMVLIRSLTTAGPAVTSAGPHYPVTGIPPVAAPGLQIWTGSNGPRSLAATGRRADGWIPGHAADWLSSAYRQARPIVDAAALEAGRKPSDVATIYNFPGAITDHPLDRTRDDEGRWIGGSAGQWVEELTGAVLEHGAAGFTYFPRGSNADEPVRWAQEIVPAVRAAIS